MAKLTWYISELAKERELLEVLKAGAASGLPNSAELIADVENQIRQLEEAIERFESIVAAKSE